MRIDHQFKEKQIKYNTYINNNKDKISTTLDIKHKEKIKEFDNQDKILKKKEKLHKKLMIELEKLEKIKSIDLTSEIINNKSNLKNEIENLDFEIKELDNRNQELNYYNDTLNILLEYYNPNKINNNIIKINDVFSSKKKEIVDNLNDKSKLYEKYMKLTQNINIKKNKPMYNIKICNKCKIEKTVHINDGYIICTSCGDSDPILLESDKPVFKDTIVDVKTCAYKRSNHLSEILNQFQAKETTEIDDDIYEQIKEELKIQRIYDYKELNYNLIKKVLKKLRLNRYYEHINHIINNLNGLPSPSMKREEEENIKKMFKDIQEPFKKFRPKKRKNFLNYNYIIHKICELYEYDEFLPYFPLLKSRINLEEQDIVWQKICQYKNYEFIPSI
jgi:uncharacterized Zn finger protein (UPF0148 family)